MSKRRAFITGITGQDGSYLSEFLIEKGYDVYGLVRSSSRDFSDPVEKLRLEGMISLIPGDTRDIESIKNALNIARPDEIYNLASQSHVGISFQCPEETYLVNYHAAVTLVNEALTQNKNVKIYQASSSEMFGEAPAPQTESSPLHPITPYGKSKLLAYQEAVLAKRAQSNAFICSGILYNHESPRRGKNFVTRKITHSLAKVKLGLQEYFEIGNIHAVRDWGYAKDYVEAMWSMMQQEKPDDYIIATGALHSVKEFIQAAAASVDVPLTWTGEGINEKAFGPTDSMIVQVNPEFYRPVDATNLVGDSSKARRVLNWKPSVTFDQLVTLMIESDLKDLKSHA